MYGWMYGWPLCRRPVLLLARLNTVKAQYCNAVTLRNPFPETKSETAQSHERNWHKRDSPSWEVWYPTNHGLSFAV